MDLRNTYKNKYRLYMIKCATRTVLLPKTIFLGSYCLLIIIQFLCLCTFVDCSVICSVRLNLYRYKKEMFSFISTSGRFSYYASVHQWTVFICSVGPNLYRYKIEMFSFISASGLLVPDLYFSKITTSLINLSGSSLI